MPQLSRPAIAAALLATLLLSACHGGGGSREDSSGPRTNIDLAVTALAVSPSAADPEDILTVSGTIQNLGIEAANPLPGDSFAIRLNLSKDGTFELKEAGFLERIIADPIPPGGTHDFSYDAPFGGGDTLSIFGNFCNSLDCRPPETGVVGVKVDSGNTIAELDEGNNFAFEPLEVVGTHVVATFTGCNFGQITGTSGCTLTVSDPFFSFTSHRPCSNCGDATEEVFPNELYRTITVSLRLTGCTANQAPNGECGGSWRISSATAKPGLPVSTRITDIQCHAFFGDPPDVGCSEVVEIRDANY